MFSQLMRGFGIVLASGTALACSEEAKPVVAEEPSIDKRLLKFQMEVEMERLLEERSKGRWVYKNGVLKCNGYLSNKAHEEYCESDLPEDWTPLEYDGETYYIQPLSANSD